MPVTYTTDRQDLLIRMNFLNGDTVISPLENNDIGVVKVSGHDTSPQLMTRSEANHRARIIGTPSDDRIRVNLPDSNNVIVLGEGNDAVQGSAGQDHYVFHEKNFGHDVISEHHKGAQPDILNRMTFRDLRADELRFKLNDRGDLIITSLDEKKSVTVLEWKSGFEVQEIATSDHLITSERINSMLEQHLPNTNINLSSAYAHPMDSNEIGYSGGPGNDQIVGTREDNVIHGRDGDDTIEAWMGNDTIHGGNGSDHYIYRGNFGHDTIVESQQDASSTDINQISFLDIKIKDLLFELAGDDLFFTSKNSSHDSSVLIKNWKLGQKVQKIVTQDKTLTAAQIDEELAGPSFEIPKPFLPQEHIDFYS